jgi:hypothetical protein
MKKPTMVLTRSNGLGIPVKKNTPSPKEIKRDTGKKSMGK